MVKQDEVIEQVYTASAKLCGWLRTKALARELATEEPVPPSGSEEQREATTEFVVESRLPALTAKERRAAVTAYIEEVFKKTGERITKSQIWRAAGYRSRASLEQWERGDSRSHGIVDERFRSLILVEKLHLQNPGLGATKNE